MELVADTELIELREAIKKEKAILKTKELWRKYHRLKAKNSLAYKIKHLGVRPKTYEELGLDMSKTYRKCRKQTKNLEVKGCPSSLWVVA